MDENNPLLIGAILVVLLGTCIVTGVVGSAFRWAKTDGVVRYEEYHEIYGSIQKSHKDLCNLRKTPKDDKMFSQFSRNQQILQKQNMMDRWIEEYNAKSKMVSRNMWKGTSLPKTISTEDYKCYE